MPARLCCTTGQPLLKSRVDEIILCTSGSARYCRYQTLAYSCNPIGHALNPFLGFRKVPHPSKLTFKAQNRRAVRRDIGIVALFDKFTEAAIKAMMFGQQEAKTFSCSEVCSEHILLGLVAQDASSSGFYGTKITLSDAREVVRNLFGKKRRRDVGLLTGQEVPFSHNAKKVIETASTESRRMGMRYIVPEHILIALLSVGEIGAKKVVQKLGVSVDKLKDEALKRMRGEQEGEGLTPKRRSWGFRGVREGSKALNEFCRDLVEEARQQRIDPVIGRVTEVTRVIQILGRRTKNNPLLLGEPGVGKTAIAEGLALAIFTGLGPDGTPLPSWLLSKRVVQLDVALLIAGAKERGELELRVTRMLNEIQTAGNVILVVDEVHMLVGAGAVGRGSGAGLDISALFKPALARGKLQCIGATTLEEHRKHMEKDSALERRFQPLLVGEPSCADALAICEGLQRRYQQHHNCLYDSAALEAAVKLSERYIADRFLPDKALDVMDEAGSRVRITAYLARQERAAGSSGVDKASRQYRELSQVLEAKDEAVKECLFEEANLLFERERELLAQLAGPAHEGALIPVVTQADVENVVSYWTGVPVERMTEEDSQRLLRLPDALQERVVGQSEAVAAVSNALRRVGCGLHDPSRPIASLLFSGPTGVGKTELTKVLCGHYFGSLASLIRLDMSEYAERHSVAKLIGAPPGYVGYGEGGKLTEAVRRRPFCVVLLDEIEKAHPDVFNILLQLMEDGRLTDAQGRTVSFKHCLLVMTSNVGSNVIAKGGGQLGFVFDGQDEAEAEYTRIRSLVMEELKAYFRPELLNRLDEVVVFRQLSPHHVRHIADLLLGETSERVREARGVCLKVTAPVMERLCQEGFDQTYGARPLQRAVTRLVDDPLADALLGGSVEGAVVVVDQDSEGNIVVMGEGEWARECERLDVQRIVYSSTDV